MRMAVIIPAAGASTRFGDGDKLSQDLGGRPVLVRTVESFAKREEVACIIVAGPPKEAGARFEEFQSRFGPVMGFHGAKIVAGGKESREETVRKALEEVPVEMTHIAVHDGARPGISDELLTRLFEAANTLLAVVPGLPIMSTVKRVRGTPTAIAPTGDDARADSILGDAGRAVVEAQETCESVDRENLMEIQTPQVFTAEILRRAHASGDLEGATDDASLVERLGVSVYVVAGEPGNRKITTREDLALMRAWMSSSGRKKAVMTL